MYTLSTWSRQDAFEYAVESTLEVLANPTVIEGLGDSALRLTRIVEGLFMPIVRDGVANLPDDYMLTNSFALLPHIDQELDRGIAIGGSLLTPTDNRFRQVARSFSWEHSISEDASLDLERSLISDVSSPKGMVRVKLGDDKGRMSTWTVSDPNSGIMYRTRPITHTSVRRIQTADPHQVAATLLHEITHGEDHELAPVQKTYDDVFHARTELKAYHIGAVIKAAGGVLEGDGKTQEVEAMRLKYTDPQAPFEPTRELIAHMQSLGVIE